MTFWPIFRFHDFSSFSRSRINPVMVVWRKKKSSKHYVRKQVATVIIRLTLIKLVDACLKCHTMLVTNGAENFSDFSEIWRH
jgi:hypothetical protein